MSPRPISGATLSFGLVSVPVEMYPTYESSATVAFHQINPKTGARVKQELVDSKTGEKIERADIVKGYEFSKGQYVTFTKDEMKALEAKKTESIDIIEFVPADKVDRLFFDRAYFLGVGKGGDRAYILLAEALKKTKLVGIGQYNARGKSYLVMLRPMENGLVLEQLHYADEVRDIADIPKPEGHASPRELELAIQLIDQRKAAEFKPKQFKDEVQERVREQIEKKVAGEEITAEPAAEPETQVLDLMEALKRSIGGKSPAGKKAAAEKPALKAERGKAAPKHTTKVKRRASA
ncbi:MAG TPA: Ku protein [Gemmatimonadales bacterium]|jgi:DNA end-binding protein Ku